MSLSINSPAKSFHPFLLTETTVVRSCCSVATGSPVCPPGGNYQEIVYPSPPYTLKLTRCDSDLCNDSDGDGGINGGGGDRDGGALIVEGRNLGDGAGAIEVSVFTIGLVLVVNLVQMM